MMWRARLFFGLSLSLWLWPLAAAGQPPVRITVVDSGNTAIENARVCLYRYANGRQAPSRLTDANGQTTLDVASFGAQNQVSLVVSKDGYRGDAVGPVALVTLRNRTFTIQAGASNSGPVCADSPTVTAFTIDDKRPTTTSDRVTLQFRTSASYDHEVRYCATLAPGGCAPNQISGWTSLGVAEDGFEPAFTVPYTIKSLGPQTIYLRVRWVYGGESGPAGPAASATIERVPRAAVIRTFTINGGATFATSPDLDLEWIQGPIPSGAAIAYCAKESGESCGADDWQQPTASPDTVPGVGWRYRGTTSVSPSSLTGFLPVVREVDLRVRFTSYPDVVSAPASDRIYLLQPAPEGEPPLNLTEDYPVPAGQLFNLASSRGWGFSSSDPTLCFLDMPPANATTEPFSIGTSDACAFDLFANGTLADGWTFRGFILDDSRSIPSLQDCEFAVAGSPPIGGDSLHTVITVFKHPRPRLPLELSPPIFCLRDFVRVELRGPKDADWRDAIVQVTP